VPIDTLIENAAVVPFFRSINSHYASIFLKLVQSRGHCLNYVSAVSAF
jgi:hypothetical protein